MNSSGKPSFESHPPTLGVLPPVSLMLERAAFLVVASTGVVFAFDPTRPLAQLGTIRASLVVSVVFFAVALWALARAWRAVSSRRAGDRHVFHSGAPIRLAAAITIWLGVLLVSVWQAPSHTSEALARFLRLLGGVLLACAAYDLCAPAGRQELVLKGIAVSGLVIALLGLGEGAGITSLLDWLSNFRDQPTYFADVRRVSVTFVHANIAAVVLEMTPPLALGWALATRVRWLKTALALGILAAVAALALTQSRAGILTCLVVFGVLAGAAARLRIKSLAVSSLLVIGALISTVGLLLLAEPFLVVRIMSEGSNELWYRVLYDVPDAVHARPGENLVVPVRLTNAGLRAWQDGAQPFNLAYHLVKLDPSAPVQPPDAGQLGGAYLTYNGLRTSLPGNVLPHSSVDLIHFTKIDLQ